MNSVESRSNAKIILMGEHSVVYGKSAIALPFFAVEIIASVKEAKNGVFIQSELYTGELNKAPALLDGVSGLVQESLELLNLKNESLHITIKSTIPDQRGFGSSASISVAIAKALFKYAHQELSKETLTKLVGNAEKKHHTNPSGLDGDTIISKQAIYFIKHKDNINVDFDMNLDLVVADTGIPASTKEAVKIVSENVKKKASIEELGKLSDAVYKNIKEKDGQAMGKNMTHAHQILNDLGVSTKELDYLVEQANLHGALGAKLSGGGLGGCMIALCQKENTKTIQDILIKSGASKTWVLDLKEI